MTGQILAPKKSILIDEAFKTSNNERLWTAFERNIVINMVGENYLKIKSFRVTSRIWVAASFRLKLQRTYLSLYARISLILLHSSCSQRMDERVTLAYYMHCLPKDRYNGRYKGNNQNGSLPRDFFAENLIYF